MVPILVAYFEHPYQSEGVPKNGQNGLFLRLFLAILRALLPLGGTTLLIGVEIG